MLYIIDLIGTAVFAISVYSAASSKKYDIFGSSIIAGITAIGGSTLRDILLNHSPLWMSDGTYTLSILMGISAAVLFKTYVKKLRKTLNFFDSIGLGLFSVLGTEKAMSMNLPFYTCILLGVMTSSFGGVLRDILLMKKPIIFRKEMYATPSIIGSILYFLMKGVIDNDILTYICIIIISGLRLISVRFKLRLPIY